MDMILLEKKFGVPGKIKFTMGKGNLPVAEIRHQNANAQVSLYGAHVMSFQPVGQRDVLWMSALSTFEEGKPIRGGIPVCFPWFGPHESDPQKPLHGFARISQWEITGTAVLPDGKIELRLGLKDSPASRQHWPFSFRLEMVITVGASLELALTCTNNGNETFTYSDVLHSYIAVSDAAIIKLHGLAACSYYDGLENGMVKKQTESVLEIRKEESRRYFDFSGDCIVEDVGLSRRIRVSKRGSRITLIWNPWSENAKKIPDMQDDGYKTMICVESANTNDDTVDLRPGDSHTLSTTIRVD